MSQQTTNTASAGRSAEIQTAVEKIMQKEGVGYGQAWSIAMKSPELKPLFDAMQKPQALSGPDRSPEQIQASAKFAGLVQKAVHERGIGYTEAFNSIKVEEPAIFAAMQGNHSGFPPFLTKVQDLMRTRGISYDTAFSEMQQAEPALFQSYLRAQGAA